jgi:hypothetical protein
MVTKSGHIRIKDVGCYPNLTPALGCIVGCQIEELLHGVYLYHVSASSLITLGCNVEGDNLPFPFYASEVEVVSTG